jgi:hypothetical protein
MRGGAFLATGNAPGWVKARGTQRTDSTDAHAVIGNIPLVVGVLSAPTCWITSSAWKRSVGGRVRPKTWAAVRLMTNSNVVGCSTGSSVGFSPLQDIVHIHGNASKVPGHARPAGHEPTGVDKFPLGVEGGQPLVGRERRDKKAESENQPDSAATQGSFLNLRTCGNILRAKGPGRKSNECDQNPWPVG